MEKQPGGGMIDATAKASAVLLNHADSTSLLAAVLGSRIDVEGHVTEVS